MPMKPIYVKNCRECPGCMINDVTAACYVYKFINKEDLYMDLEMLDDVPEECPMMIEGGISFKIDPDLISNFDDPIDGSHPDFDEEDDFEI